MPDWVMYLAPFFPILTRGFLALRFRGILSLVLTESQMDRDASRTVVLAMAGFSFAGVVGLAVLENATQQQQFQLPLFYLLVSFLSYYVALNIQAYKFFLRLDLLSDTFIDIAGLALITAIVGIILSTKYDPLYKLVILLLALGAWGYDHSNRLRFTNQAYTNFARKEALDNAGKKQTKQ